MRAIALLLFLSVAATCYAEDPLESLNTVEDTLTTMEQTLKARAAEQGDVVYFVAKEPLGSRGWVTARMCNEDGENGEADPSCRPEPRPQERNLVWKSRTAHPSELRPGAVVIAHDARKEGSWVVARVVDVAEVENGYVAISAGFKAKVRSLRIVEE